jgi:hypothetical protein
MEWLSASALRKDAVEPIPDFVVETAISRSFKNIFLTLTSRLNTRELTFAAPSFSGKGR